MTFKGLLRLAVLLTLPLCVLTGCITVRMAGPEPTDLDNFNARNLAAVPPVTTNLPAGQRLTQSLAIDPGARVIVIGHVGVLFKARELQVRERWAAHRRTALQGGGEAAAEHLPSLDWYLAHSAGYAKIEVIHVPGQASTSYQQAEVPKDLAAGMGFGNSVADALVGDTGDLVAAELLPRYGFWITRVLCREAETGFGDCERRYQRGAYQPIDGAELDGRWQLLVDGGRIDVNTYEVLKRRHGKARRKPRVGRPP